MPYMKYGLLLLLSMFVAGGSFAKPLTIGGSSTFYSAFFDSRLDEIYAHTGINLSVYVSSSGRGLIALSEGRVDAAMLSSDFDLFLQGFNDDYDVQLNRDDYEYKIIDQANISFVVHPDNPVTSLTRQQIRQALTGEITSWADFGYPELGDIHVVTEHPTGGMYLLVKQELLQGAEYVTDHTVLQNAPQVAAVIAQLPGAIGFLSDKTSENLLSRVKSIDCGEDLIDQVLGLVYLKSYPADVMNVLTEFLMQGRE